MNKEAIIANTAAYVQEVLQDAEGGHDWQHIRRVWSSAKTIASTEQVDAFVVELGALLHDIADSKFHDGDEEKGPQLAVAFLQTQGLGADIIDHVEAIIRNISFKGGNFQTGFSSTELAVVRDADRLDAIGAIGIARTFNYGGFKNRALYDPSIPPNLHMTKEEYKRSTAPTINHFYEKLLLLKDLMHTESGKKMAQERHAYMEAFLEQFFAEWEGKK
jgi:uncharacterized protein